MVPDIPCPPQANGEGRSAGPSHTSRAPGGGPSGPPATAGMSSIAKRKGWFRQLCAEVPAAGAARIPEEAGLPAVSPGFTPRRV
ncbi:hypothetical protein GCM10010406_13060 [Streptomyces thermolineatus]|uniref:Uncharacterized protein n=1 Tax=Streptomyces thermolineatus TaxID=44033 RepID=A0ABN3L6Q0_9ACTN